MFHTLFLAFATGTIPLLFKIEIFIVCTSESYGAGTARIILVSLLGWTSLDSKSSLAVDKLELGCAII